MDELLIEPEPTERELRTAPIKPLFARYAAITFAGMLAQMVMVVLEGLIIGNGLGPLGLAAVTVILPLELLNLALGGALGMGTAWAAATRRARRRCSTRGSGWPPTCWWRFPRPSPCSRRR